MGADVNSADMRSLDDQAATETQAEADLPLAGFTVGVTATRRCHELTAAFERRGGRVVAAPAINIVPLLDDQDLKAATECCLAQPPDLVIATTGVGFRGWLQVADSWGLGEDLRSTLKDAEIIARGPKTRGAIRAAGLRESWSPPSESIAEVVKHLSSRGIANLRVAVQLHGEPLQSTLDELRSAGAAVMPIPVYRWVLPDDLLALKRLVTLTTQRQIDALTFTSAPAAAAFLKVATQMGLASKALEVLRHDVMLACVGPVCAQPLLDHDLPVALPPKARLGQLIRLVAEELPRRGTSQVTIGDKVLELRSHAVVVDGKIIALPLAPMAVLRAMAREPGRVYTRAELACFLPGRDAGTHAVEMAVTRLRSNLGEPGMVQTVVKRGYRLACTS